MAALPTEVAHVQETKSRPTHASSGSKAIRDRVSPRPRLSSLPRPPPPPPLSHRVGDPDHTPLYSSAAFVVVFSGTRFISSIPFRIRLSSSPKCLVSKSSLTVDVARVLPAPPQVRPQGWTPPVSQLLGFAGTFVTSISTLSPPPCAVTDLVIPHVLIRV
jgi:hypothetical protein